MRLYVVAGRVVTAALLVWMAAIHLHLWDDGYRHIDRIGTLFLVDFVAGVIAAIAVLAAPRRLLPLAALAAAGLAAGTLTGLLVSVNDGLFGFHESLSAPYAKESIAVEAVTVLAGLGLGGPGLRALLLSGRGGGRRRRSPSASPAVGEPAPPEGSPSAPG